MQKTAKLALSGIGVALAVVAAVGLQGCATPNNNSSSNDSTSNISNTVGNAVVNGAANVAETAKNMADETVNKTTENVETSNKNAAYNSETGEASFEGGIGERDGKHTITGTVRCTTYADRAKEVDWKTPDFDQRGTLTLIELPEPVTVTTYKGGGEWTGKVQWIKVPDDEAIRRFKDQKITIGVDTWGNAPSDITGVLYDLTLTYDYDGLVVFED